MERDSALSSVLQEDDEEIGQRSAFWHMQAVFGKLRESESPPDNVVPPLEASAARLVSHPQPSFATAAEPSLERERPSWLGPEPGQGGVAVTRCEWAMSPLDRSEGTNDDGCHAVLGVVPNTGVEQLRHRFRQLVKKHHPDRGGDESTFRDLATAYREALRLRASR